MRIADFLQYNNAVPVAVSILLLGAGGAFAATDPAAIYSAQQRVISVDNTYLVSKDLSTYTPRIQISTVNEDADNYYVGYTFSTIDAVNNVWRDVANNQTLTVSKAQLGTDKDLGVYVGALFSNMISHEKDRLKETQDTAKQNVSQKVVATTYGGLIGKFLDDTTEVVPGYTPVVTPPPPPPPAPPEVAAAASAQPQVDPIIAVLTSQPAPSPAPPVPMTSEQIQAMIRDQVQQILAQRQGTSSSPAPAPTPSPSPSPVPPVISIAGNNPANLTVGDSYIDLGASITGPAGDLNLGIHASVDDGPTLSLSDITIDTSAPGTHTILYSATDQNGVTGTATRTVIVDAPAGTASSTPAQSPAPAPAPSPVPTTDTTASSSTSTTP